ncbi:MAG: hypothetical protein QW051_04050 [Candidatus Aenigmatarchaeota archaeon]
MRTIIDNSAGNVSSMISYTNYYNTTNTKSNTVANLESFSNNVEKLLKKILDEAYENPPDAPMVIYKQYIDNFNKTVNNTGVIKVGGGSGATILDIDFDSWGVR